jgi:invasion protein IalB
MLRILFAISFLFCTYSYAGHKKGDPPPKVTTQQYTSWTYQCVEDHGKKNCEVSQSLQLQNSNIRFGINYARFKNQDNEIKEIISVIGPLGVNLSRRLAIKFDDKEQFNLSWTKCEVIGCMVILTNNTKDKASLDNYNKIKKNFSSGKKVAIGVAGFGPQPLAIEINLNGFSSASKKLENEKL